MNLHFLIVSTTVLASCAATTRYEEVLYPWAGAQEVELVRNWGPPVQSYEVSGRKFVVYESRRSLLIPGTASTGLIGGNPAAMDIELSCTTTFELENLKVISWSYEGNDCSAKKWTPFRT